MTIVTDKISEQIKVDINALGATSAKPFDFQDMAGTAPVFEALVDNDTYYGIWLRTYHVYDDASDRTNYRDQNIYELVVGGVEIECWLEDDVTREGESAVYLREHLKDILKLFANLTSEHALKNERAYA